MAVPNAPMPLFWQTLEGGSIVITVPLKGLSSAAAGFTAGSTFNSGNPTATFTLTLPAAPTTSNPVIGSAGTAAVTNSAALELLNLIDKMWREGDFTSVA